jgi:hypothetical protein
VTDAPKRRGRPPAAPEDKRSCALLVRLTEGEHGLVSAYLRGDAGAVARRALLREARRRARASAP